MEDGPTQSLRPSRAIDRAGRNGLEFAERSGMKQRTDIRPGRADGLLTDCASFLRYPPVDPQLLVLNRGRLKEMLPAHSLVVLNANDVPLTNADGTSAMIPNSDLFYFTGV